MLTRRTLLIIAGLVLLSVALWAVAVALRPLPSRSFTMATGPEGSATRALALRLMELNNVDLERFRFEASSPERAAEALRGGQLDAVVIDTAWESPAAQRLLADPSLDLVSFPRADAYVALLPHLSKVQLPMGVANLALNRPSQDITLIAPKAQLVVRSDLHPALQYLLIDAAERIHGGPGVFNRAGAFPAPEQVDLPLSRAGWAAA